MSPKDITAIAIKFFGIYLMVNVILYFPSMIMSLTALEQFREEDFSSTVFVSVIGAFIILGMAVSYVLFRLANSIASKAPDATEIYSQPTQEFLLQLLGIYFIVSGLSTMPGFGISLFKEGTVEITKIFYGFGYLFQVLVGCYLLTKPLVWGQCLNKLRGRS